MNEDTKKNRYSFIAVPREIYKELNGDELKLFLYLMDECEKYEKSGKTFFKNQKNLSKDMGWGSNCIKLKKNIDSLLRKNLITVNVGNYLVSDPTASEYHINWDEIHRHQNSDGSNMSEENHRHQNGDAIYRTILLSTIYTMEFLKNECPKGLSIEDVTDEILDEMRTYTLNRMGIRNDGKKDAITSIGETTINTMEESTAAPAPDTEEELRRKEEIELFNEGHDKHRSDICKNVKSTADYERFYNLLKKDIEYVQGSDWVKEQKDKWFNSFNIFWGKCEPYIMKNLKKIQEREKRRREKEEKKRSKDSNATQRHLEEVVSIGDKKVFEFWIGELENTPTDAQNAIDQLFQQWNDKYEADAIAMVCQECGYKAAGEPQATHVDNYTTQDKITQPEPFEMPKAKIYYPTLEEDRLFGTVSDGFGQYHMVS